MKSFRKFLKVLMAASQYPVHGRGVIIEVSNEMVSMR